MTPDAFGLMLGGSDVEFGGTLVNAATVTTANDKVRVTSAGAAAGQLRVYCRENSQVPGMAEGILFKSTGSFANPARALTDSGVVLMNAPLGGAVTATVDDNIIFTDDHGVLTVLMRRGQTIPGIEGAVFNTMNTTSVFINNNGMMAFQGLLQNADGTALAANSAFIGARAADGTVSVIARQGDAVPGLAGFTYGSINGATSICVSDSGVVVFSATCLPSPMTAIMAWDAANGLRILAKTGDTNFTGTAANQLTLIGSTGSNGNGGGTGLASNGWLTLRAGDSVGSIYAVARIKLDATAPCTSDLSGDGSVGAEDLALLLNGWGTNSPDLTGDGVVGAEDLSILLNAWGACP